MEESQSEFNTVTGFNTVPLTIVEQIDSLNEHGWRVKRSDTKRALELATQARDLANTHSYERGVAYSLRNSSYCYELLGDYQAGTADALEAIDLFKKLEDKHGLASSLNCMGYIYLSLGEYSEAIGSYSQSLELCEKVDNKFEASRAINNSGNVYFHLGDYAKALEYYQRSLQIRAEINAVEDLPRTLTNIGAVHEQLGAYEKAADYYLRAMQTGREIGDAEIEGTCLANLGMLYRLIGDYPIALEHLLKAADVSQKHANKYSNGGVFVYLGKLYQAMGEHEKALDSYRKGLDIFQQIGLRMWEGEALIGLGELFLEREEYPQAVESLSEAVSIAEQIGNSEQMFRAHFALSQACERQADYVQSLNHYKEFYKFRQMVFGEEADKNLKRVMIQAEVEKAQKEAEIYRLKHVELAARVKELEEASRELQDANRRQADFVSGVSHELKTPLTLIRLYGETLLYGNGFPEEVRQDYYQIITRESERLTHLVDNVLDFSRIDRGVKQYSFQEGDMGAVVNETVTAHARHLRRAGFTVDMDLTTDSGPVRFDPDALSEVVSNLLDNAAKYCGDEKQISVSLRSDDSNVVLEIKDQGLGIPESDHERIFEQFYRGTQSTDKGGSGLGLFLVKHIMDAHGGTIEVKSEPGQGSSFRLVFPLNHKGLEGRTLSAL